MKRCILLSLTTLIFASQIAVAGPVRERIMERLAERRQNNDIDDADTSPSQKFALPAGAVLKSDVPYGKDKSQRMDVYIPQGVRNAPVILMVHGGGWRRGDKAMNRMVENKVKRWLPKGIIFVSVNYRMLPEADPLVQARDVALALARAQSLAPSWGGDSMRFIIMGHSAGAHLVALITAAPEIATQQGAEPWLGTVMLDSGGYDIEQTMSSRHFPLYDKAFGTDRTFWQATSPSHQLTQKTVPLFAVCSSTRKDQPCQQAQAFIDKAAALGTQATLLPVAMSHREINENLGLPGAYTDKVENFIRALGVAL